MLDCRAILLLWLLPWAAHGRTVPRSSSPDWAQCQQLSQNLCTLAWSAHPREGPMVSVSSWSHAETFANLRSVKCDVSWVDSGGLKVVTE